MENIGVHTKFITGHIGTRILVLLIVCFLFKAPFHPVYKWIKNVFNNNNSMTTILRCGKHGISRRKKN